MKPVERLALQLIKHTNSIGEIRNTLADITADGRIDDEEQPKLKEILSFLGDLKTNISEIELYCRKEGLL
jgi:tellurite resistance protein